MLFCFEDKPISKYLNDQTGLDMSDARTHTRLIYLETHRSHYTFRLQKTLNTDLRKIKFFAMNVSSFQQLNIVGNSSILWSFPLSISTCFVRACCCIMCHCFIEISPLICYANQWTGFYIIGTSVMKKNKFSLETRGDLLNWNFFKFFNVNHQLSMDHFKPTVKNVLLLKFCKIHSKVSVSECLFK